MEKGRINQISSPFPLVDILCFVFPLLFLLHPLIHLNSPDKLHRVFNLQLKITVHQLFFIGAYSGGIHELKVTVRCRVTIVNFNTLLLGFWDQWLYLNRFSLIVPKDREWTEDQANTKNYFANRWAPSTFLFTAVRIGNYDSAGGAIISCLRKRLFKLVIGALVYLQCTSVKNEQWQKTKERQVRNPFDVRLIHCLNLLLIILIIRWERLLKGFWGFGGSSKR